MFLNRRPFTRKCTLYREPLARLWRSAGLRPQAFSGKRPTLQQSGSVLLAVIIMFPFLALIAAYYMELSVASLRVAKKDQWQTHAQFATDAGIDYAVQQINIDDTWSGTGGEVTLLDSSTTNTKSTYEVTVADIGSNKQLTAVGRTFSPRTHSTADSTVTITVDLRPVTTGNYSIVTGVGGLYMSNQAKIIGGDVHVNGEISMTGSAQIGLSTSPVNLKVAHQICPNPANATYPQLCGAGNGEPITIANPAHIYGDVQANNQSTSTRMSDPGLTASSGVAALALPSHDRDAQKAAAVNNLTGASASCTSHNGTITWAANTKITGNVTINNNCVVTVEGNVWITGTLSVTNSGQMKVADSLGTTTPDIMIDGATGAEFRNSAKLVSNSSSTGFQVLTYKSAASCSPDCADVTGTDLYNSRNTVTILLTQTAEAPNTVFYARWTRVNMGNSGQIGALIGQTIDMNNSATITFGTSIPGLSTTGWVIDGYRRTF